ncbi:hypothetical protein P153DRAFT_328080 [Dothidotthia symphoricarpi CBS 119687]|uniref:Uncharacterized protein n=1 Tax=Dothidotthia symphoricarpi CBS 119687 TaxID=1392245 RepID=A0A6A5ZVG5_9PLEO|nr:uncharacterized protein P153DRAFT_328080 [Dothidotthia symphoricarpi CBS 119687]KAF2123509.1 hypothetical protein P153DRAFT_328080 [Dothidotthia symphoricarpi CBS 119687]
MHFVNSLYAIALAFATTSINASPIANQADEFATLDKRAVIDCGESYRFTTAAQEKGYNDAIAHLDAGTTVKAAGAAGTEYPHYYGDSQGLITTSACTGAGLIDYREYPVFVTDTTTFVAGMQAGQERVVIARFPNRVRVKCGIISHRGQTGGNFKFCGI